MQKIRITCAALIFLSISFVNSQNYCCSENLVKSLGDYVYLIRNSNNGAHNYYYSIVSNNLPNSNGIYDSKTRWVLSIWVELSELDKIYQINWNAVVKYKQINEKELIIPRPTGHYGQYVINRKGFLKIYQKDIISQSKPIITHFGLRYNGTQPLNSNYKLEDEEIEFDYKEKN